MRPLFAGEGRGDEVAGRRVERLVQRDVAGIPGEERPIRDPQQLWESLEGRDEGDRPVAVVDRISWAAGLLRGEDLDRFAACGRSEHRVAPELILERVVREDLEVVHEPLDARPINPANVVCEGV